jgi:hypothetical protein
MCHALGMITSNFGESAETSGRLFLPLSRVMPGMLGIIIMGE